MSEMNKTQLEVIGFIFGLFFSFSEEDIFLKYIAPIILNDPSSASNPAISLGIAIIQILSVVASFFVLYKIIKNIEWVYRNRRYIFGKFIIKIIITAVVSFLIFHGLRYLILR